MNDLQIQAQTALDQLAALKATLSLMADHDDCATGFTAYFGDDLQSLEEDLLSERDEEGL